jgi:N6-L-threonylcarbamoyladenine synthase
LNRKNRVGTLPPSVQNKVDAHVKVIGRVCALLPITSVTIETAQFDVQKIKKPEIQGVEYQQGPQLGFENVKAYVLFRDGHKCQRCKGKSKDKYLRVHHIESRKTGGDSPDNLITLCKTCHEIIHREGLTKTFKRPASFRDAGQMTIMRKFVFIALKTLYPEVKETYGYVTKYTRVKHGLEKSHTVDARCISGNPSASAGEYFLIKQMRKQNRRLHKNKILKGNVRKANKAVRYVFAFQLFDKVIFKGQECFIFGRRSSGSFDIRLLDGTKVSAHVSHKKLRLVEKAGAFLTQKANCLALQKI